MMQIPLDTFPEFARELGRLAGHWAVVEAALEMLFVCQIEQDEIQARLIYQNFVSQGHEYPGRSHASADG
jgi:hypothetical protein